MVLWKRRYKTMRFVYLDGKESSFTSLMQVVEFGEVSGLRVGWDKSIAFPICPPLAHNYLSNSNLQMTQAFKYLGIQIHNELSKYEDLNVTPIIKQMVDRLQTWSTLSLNLIGRINIFKMIYLPKCLYCFRAAPIYLPKKLFLKIESTLSSFIWSNTQLRIAKSSLQASKLKGGLAYPNLHDYFIASQLTYVYDSLPQLFY